MKRIVFFAAALIALFGAYNWWVKNVGDVRPVVLPSGRSLPSESSPETTSGVSATLTFPLTVPEGFRIGTFAQNLSGVRDLVFSPGGALLASLPNQGRVVGMRDTNDDGEAEQVTDVFDGLDNPHGITFHNGKLFIVEETQVVRYFWDEENLTARRDKKLFDLPPGGRHSTRSITFDPKGKMHISLGSTCDVCVEKHPWIGTVIVSDENGSEPRVFAKGLRNAVFIVTHPETGKIWGTEMGRDFLGDETPPDEVNVIEDKKDYGWPYCYGDRTPDTEFSRDSTSRCPSTAVPAYKIPAHSAPLGLTFVDSDQFPSDWQGDLLVAYHGSWNRSTPIGYKVVRLDVEGERVVGSEDVITGFLAGSDALGRPVDVVFDTKGSLFVSDDKAGAIYKVVKE